MPIGSLGLKLPDLTTTLIATEICERGYYNFNFYKAGSVYTTAINPGFIYSSNASSTVSITYSHLFKDAVSSANNLSFDSVFNFNANSYFDFKRGSNSLFKIQSDGIDAVSKKIINVLSGTASTDAINLGQLTSYTNNLYKTACLVATTKNIALITGVTSVAYNNGTAGVGATLTIVVTAAFLVDDILVALGDRLLVKNQTTTAQNGIYTITTLTATSVVLTRATDYNAGSKITKNDLIDIIKGTVNASTRWNQTTSTNITVGTTAILFSNINPVAKGDYLYPSLVSINNSGQITSITPGTAPVTAISLTGAVEGTYAGGAIATNLNDIQALLHSSIEFQWPVGVTANYNTQFIHSLSDTLPLSSSAPSFYETVRTGAGATLRYWQIRMSPGNSSLPTPDFTLRFYHNIFSGSYLTGATIINISYVTGSLGSAPRFTTTLNSSLVLSANETITNTTPPTQGGHLVNKLYADALLKSQLNLTGNGVVVCTDYANNVFYARTIGSGNGIYAFNPMGGDIIITVNQSQLPLNNFPVNAHVSLGGYNLTSTGGTISAQTGSLQANYLKRYNLAAIYSDPLYISSNYMVYASSYGYLNSSGNVGTAGGTNSYSINCDYRVKASEFNAVSSIKKKTIISSGIDAENEVIDTIKRIEFFKYQYKDQIAEPGIRYGIIAEELGKILPDYVNYDNMEYIPNVMSRGDIRALRYNRYIITIEKELSSTLKGKIKIISGQNISYPKIVDIIDNKTIKVRASSEDNLPEEGAVFVYGTYETCPAIDTKISELALIAFKNLVMRVEKLEKRRYGKSKE